MVNYCCVYGCGRNGKTSKHLYFYTLPKERLRLAQWLEAVGRPDLLEKDIKKLTNRVCSRHFTPSSFKNKHLCADAVPSLCLPNGNWSDGSDEESEIHRSSHKEIICDSCNKSVLGFRYKCVTCTNYDLCSKCEVLEAHAHHYMLRIPKPVSFTVADNLINKWRQLINAENIKVENKRGSENEGSSDDDVPITRYAKNYDSGIDLSEEVRAKISDEVTRVLNMKLPDKNGEESAKRQLQKKKGSSKKRKEGIADNSVGTERLKSFAPEVAFADVNDIKGNDMPNTLTPLGEPVEVPAQLVVVHNTKLNEELSEFLIGVKYP